MLKQVKIVFMLFAVFNCVAVAQNTFPSSGDVGIGTTTSLTYLETVGAPGGGQSVKANLLPPIATSLLNYDNSGTPSINKFVFYENPGTWVGGLGLSTNSLDLLVGPSGGYHFYTGVTNVDGTGASPVFTILSSGNIGIGTISPTVPLEVYGSIKITPTSGGSITYADGTTQGTAWTGTLTGGDYAESVDVTGDRNQYEPGDVLVIDPNNSHRFLKAAEPYSLAVTGVYSTKPGVVGRRQKTDKALSTTEVPMAMVGIVPTKVSAENGPIRRGDVLVSSSTPGYAMKGTDRGLLAGAVIGKALEPLDSGTGLIEAVISLQ